MDLIWDLVLALLSKIVKFQPSVRRVGDKIVAGSGFATHAFTLGFYGRRVVIDPAAKTIDMRVRRFWFFTSKELIRFDEIRQVVYGYRDLANSYADHRAEESFIVGVELKRSLAQIELFQFAGEGEWVNEVWPDWMYPEQKMLDMVLPQDQEAKSSGFVDTLSSLIGVPVGMYRP